MVSGKVGRNPIRPFPQSDRVVPLEKWGLIPLRRPLLFALVIESVSAIEIDLILLVLVKRMYE